MLIISGGSKRCLQRFPSSVAALTASAIRGRIWSEPGTGPQLLFGYAAHLHRIHHGATAASLGPHRGSPSRSHATAVAAVRSGGYSHPSGLISGGRGMGSPGDCLYQGLGPSALSRGRPPPRRCARGASLDVGGGGGRGSGEELE